MTTISHSLTKAISVSDIYVIAPIVPDGYEFVEFGMTKGRLYLTTPCGNEVSAEYDAALCSPRGPRIIVRKVPKKVKVTRWMNVYKHQGCWHWESRARADASAGERRIACIPFELEVDEGTVL